MTVLDYGAGNVRSLKNAIRRLGFDIEDVSFFFFEFFEPCFLLMIIVLSGCSVELCTSSVLKDFLRFRFSMSDTLLLMCLLFMLVYSTFS